MNSKGIVAIEDTDICMKCLKKKATHTYRIYGRGYGSSFDMSNTKFQCCDDCDKPEYEEWFNEQKVMDDYVETYQHEEKIWDLVKSLPLESQELFENRFDSDGWHMDAQDWIDYQLDELPHEKCKEYCMYSPKDIEAYETKFTTCEYVTNVTWSDGSQGSWCPFGANGDYGQKVDNCGNLSDECTDCQYYKKRENPIKEIKGDDLNDWEEYMKAKLKEDEYKSKFE